MTDNDELYVQQAELVGLLDAEESYEDTLRRIAGLACTTIPGCSTASVTLWREGSPYTIVSTDPVAREVDAAQYETMEGPCLDASRYGEIYVIADMETETRWPVFTELALRRGIRASFSVPLVVRESSLGALNMYSTEPGAFGDAADLGSLFAAQAAVAIANVDVYHASRALAQQLEEAMLTRAVIEQAKGVLIADRGCTADEAFELLKTASQRQNVKLREVARRIVSGRTAQGESS